MKKEIKKIIGLMLALLIMVGMNTTTYASEYIPSLGDTVDGSLLTDEDSAESILYNRTRGNILNSGVARISNNGDGSVNAYGAVLPAVQCDTLRLTINIQRLQNGTWVNVKSYSSTAYNATYLTKSYNCTVTRGYYYRVMAGCIATKGGTTETQMPVTNGIWI
ncbi:MAG TPA: hypothetical protein H9747_10585 [Candidatus Blautia stercorigallinarum]|uniref:Uncharacterized protein n=1 Tax=Candidatus Blautia stercorigallinarum TaxID=2838501 RepID=A0A9D1TGH6_9FIRM|nr:hypothetical protein [Candidatus Blautia stercorigallinarum]